MTNNAIQELTRIIQKVAHTTLPEEQVQVIVSDISTTLSVNVSNLNIDLST